MTMSPERVLDALLEISREVSGMAAEIDRLRAENMYLLKLRDLVIARRAMEPQHSREDHECPECEVLSDLAALERMVKTQNQ
jgi:hypothetical protein